MEADNSRDSVIFATHVHSAWCLLISTFILGATVITTSALRSLIRFTLSDSLISRCLLDFLCGLELCMCGYELGVILDIYDTPVYCVYLWIVLIWQGVGWVGASPSPHSHLVRWQSGNQSLLETGLRSGSGCVGALLSFSVITILWKFDLSHFHEDREIYSSSLKCNDDLQVSMEKGVIIEMIGSMMCFMIGSLLLDIPQLETRPKMTMAIDSVLGVMLVMAGFDLTGGYYSPALALGTKVGCGSGGLAKHLLIYTLGPCVGALLAEPCYQTCKNFIVKSEKKKEL